MSKIVDISSPSFYRLTSAKEYRMSDHPNEWVCNWEDFRTSDRIYVDKTLKRAYRLGFRYNLMRPTIHGGDKLI